MRFARLVPRGEALNGSHVLAFYLGGLVVVWAVMLLGGVRRVARKADDPVSYLLATALFIVFWPATIALLFRGVGERG